MSLTYKKSKNFQILTLSDNQLIKKIKKHVKHISVYPNPAHDRVTVSIDVKENMQFTLKLTDLSGRVILTENHEGNAGLNTYEIDLALFAKRCLHARYSIGNRQLEDEGGD